MDFSSMRFGIYILGAGFSKPAGLPLAQELWDEVRRRAHNSPVAKHHFEADLRIYLRYKKECTGKSLTPHEVDFEDFMAFLDIEHYLWLRGSDTWSQDGNETQVIIKALIGEILTERIPSKREIPDLYLRFAEILRPNDYILTFNYDVLLERALEIAGVRFRLVPERYKPDPERSDTLLVDSRDEVVIFKLHGSIDWFDKKNHVPLEGGQAARSLPPGWYHPVFDAEEDLGVTRLIEGPCFPTDPLIQVHRVQNIEKLYSDRFLLRASPWILNPSHAKMVYTERLKKFWHDLGRAGAFNFDMAIIGYSLPRQDEYVRQVIWRLAKNYQNVNWGKKRDLKHTKTPVVLINLTKSQKQERQLRQTYAFLNWKRTCPYFKGFNDDALEILRRR